MLWIWCPPTGVYNVVCDIPEKTITVSSSLSPRTIVSLVRRVMGTAQIINIIEPPYPVQPAYLPPLDRTRYSSYDDMYSYDGQGRQPGYSSSYSNPYNGRSYDNEFRPARYSNYREYWSIHQCIPARIRQEALDWRDELPVNARS